MKTIPHNYNLCFEEVDYDGDEIMWPAECHRVYWTTLGYLKGAEPELAQHYELSLESMYIHKGLLWVYWITDPGDLIRGIMNDFRAEYGAHEITHLRRLTHGEVTCVGDMHTSIEHKVIQEVA